MFSPVQHVLGPNDRIAEEVDNVRSVLDDFSDVLGSAGLPRIADVYTVDAAESALETALDIVVLQMQQSERSNAEQVRQATAFGQLRRAQIMLAGAVTLRRSDALSSVRMAIDNIRQVGTVAEFVVRVPIEATRLGFDRCLLSRVSNGLWITRSAFARDDADFGEALVDAGNRTPRTIDARLVEYDLLRKRKSLLVRDAESNDRVRPDFKQLGQPVAYVVAPVVANGSIVGLIHGDLNPDSNPVDEFDRDLLDAFSCGLGLALEGLNYRARFDRIRSQMDDDLDNAGPSILGDGSESPDSVVVGGVPPTTGSRPRQPNSLLERLTDREAEVLAHVVKGETNRRIAARLYVSETTVKAHMKHILRKLEASNRAEAVSRYFGSP